MNNTDEAADTAPDGPQAAKPWLSALKDARKRLTFWQEKCDSIEKLYSNLEKLAGGSTDRQFQIFWANLEVLKPSIYTRAPVPVVEPRFKKRDDLARRASEVLERALISDFDADDVHGTMVAIRDDLAITARGVAWLRLDTNGETEVAAAEHLDRDDFLHEPARKWREVGWVARRAWLTREQWEARFGHVHDGAKFETRKDADEDEGGKRTSPVWEIWSRTDHRVIWVSETVEDTLDEREPHLDLNGFFPCPRPAYGTIQRRSLIPVPDFVYYKDQVEEINELTARISGLSEALRMKGFYAAGSAEIGEALEAAFKNTSNEAIMVPVAALTGMDGGFKNSVAWLPIREVAATIQELVGLRRQLIDDVYQITGLSDIMRGSTQASETLGAQQLKSQYGSVRIKDRQAELVRMARDITRIKSEIMAENFEPETLLSMSQVDDLPSRAQWEQQQAQAHQAGQQPQQPPVLLDDVVQLLRSQRTRPFVLDIETDSTIQPDEDAEKQRRTEAVAAIGGFIQQAAPMVMQQPETAPLAAATLKFLAGAFRASRELDAAIDEFADMVEQKAKSPPEPPQPSPEEIKAQADVQAMQQKSQIDAQAAASDVQSKQIDAQIRAQEAQLGMAKTEAEIRKIEAEIMRIGAQAHAASQPKEKADA